MELINEEIQIPQQRNGIQRHSNYDNEGLFGNTRQTASNK